MDVCTIYNKFLIECVAIQYRIAGIFARGKFSPILPVSSGGENLTGENFVG